MRKGDTVLSVADDFGVPAEKVRQWNRLQGNALRAGQSLTIFKPADGAVVERTAATSSHRRLRTSEAHTKPEHSDAPSDEGQAARGKARHKDNCRRPAAKSPKAKDLAKTTHSSKKHKQRG